MYLFIFILILPVILYFAFQIRPVQDFMNQKATILLSEKLNTNVTIGHISYNAPFDIVMQDFFVEDYQKDTLFFIKLLKIRPLHYNFSNKNLTIDKIFVKGFRTEYRIDSTGYSNYDFFISNLPQTDNSDDTSSSSTNIIINKIEFKKSSLFYSTEVKDTLPYQFDVDTFDIANFNLKIKKLKLEGEDVSLKIDKFNLFEKNGFKVRNFSSDFSLTENKLSLIDFRLRLNKSRIILNELNLNYNSIEELSEKPENTNLSVDIREQTKIEFSDLGYFSELFKNYNESIQFGMNISGNIGNLVSERFLVKFKNSTYILGNFEFLGLPNAENMYFDIKFEELKTNLTEILSVKNPLDNNSAFFVLPNSVNIPNDIEFKGGITGKPDDFIFTGIANTSVGYFDADLQIILDSLYTRIIGGFSLENLDVGHIAKNEMVGKISLTDSLDITMYDTITYEGYNNIKISNIEFNKYNYQNIVSDIEFIRDSITAFIDINDPNFVFTFDGATKLAGIDTRTKFSLDIDTANLYPLNITKDDKYAQITVAFEGDFTGNNIDDLEGTFNLTEPLVLIKNLEKMTLNKFSLDANNNKKVGDNTLKKINLNSELFSGYVEGTFNFEDLGLFSKNLANYYFPSLNNDSIVNLFYSEKDVGNNLRFKFVIKNIDPITQIFAPTINISKRTKLEGSLSSLNKQFEISIYADSILLSGNKIKDLTLVTKGDENKISTTINCDSIGIAEFRFENFKIIFEGENDSAEVKLTWHNNSKLRNFGEIKTNLVFQNDSMGNINLKLNIPTDSFYVNNKKWVLYSKGIFIDTNEINIEKINLTGELVKNSSMKQHIGLYGKISDRKEDTLNIAMDKFDISQLNPILPDIKIEGYMKSDFSATSLTDTPKVVMTSHIDGFAINDVALGEVKQTVKWLDKDKKLHTQLAVQKVDTTKNKINGKDTVKIYRSFFVDGDYFIESQSFDFNIEIDNLKFKPFAPYLDEYVKFSRNSNLNGKLNINGDKVFYKIGGELNIFGAFTLPSTGINYTINGGLKILLKENKIVITPTQIAGPKLAGDALLYGNIKHQNFQDPYIDMHLRADTIAFMDLKWTNQSKYYGAIVASGNIDIKGYPENLTLVADIETEKKTDFTVLLDRPDEVSNKTSIVTFVTPEDTVFTETVDKQTSDFDIDLTLKLNPEAKFKIIFNELTGEALEIQGAGNINVKKTAIGDLIIVGKVSITKGLYNFVLENIVKREFEIVKGSSIDFNGDPLDGVLDVSTKYSIKNVNLYNLLMDEKYSEEKTQADCFINLKGTIMNPEIRFSVDLPKADQRIAGQVNNLDDANMNKQLLSLLIFGRFQPLPGLTFDPNANVAANAFNAGELISNQLNSLLSNLNSDIELDVNYVTGNEQTTDQFDVGFSTGLVNDRIRVTTDVGVGGNTTGSGEQNNFIGDFEVDAKLNKKGNIRLKAFNKTNRNEFYDRGPYTQGIGILYKTEFDHIFKQDTTQKHQKDTLK